MMYKEAVDTSPLDVAINMTGNQGVIIRWWNCGYETLAQRPDTGEWEHVGINYGATVGLDRHAWEPLAERLDGIAR